jgi:hypothetical protein
LPAGADCFIGLAKNEFEGLSLECTGTENQCVNGVQPGQAIIDVRQRCPAEAADLLSAAWHLPVCSLAVQLLGFSNLGSVGQNAGILFALM